MAAARKRDGRITLRMSDNEQTNARMQRPCGLSPSTYGMGKEMKTVSRTSAKQEHTLRSLSG